MTEAARPQLIVLQKPKFGQPCNRCGRCCAEQLCDIAKLVFHRTDDIGPCPALELDGEVFACGMIRRPSFYIMPHWQSPEERAAAAEEIAPMIKHYLQIGVGCGMPDKEAL